MNRRGFIRGLALGVAAVGSQPRLSEAGPKLDSALGNDGHRIRFERKWSTPVLEGWGERTLIEPGYTFTLYTEDGKRKMRVIG